HKPTTSKEKTETVAAIFGRFLGNFVTNQLLQKRRLKLSDPKTVDYPFYGHKPTTSKEKTETRSRSSKQPCRQRHKPTTSKEKTETRLQRAMSEARRCHKPTTSKEKTETAVALCCCQFC